MAKPYIFDHTITDWLKEIGKRAVGRAEEEKYYRGERPTTVRPSWPTATSVWVASMMVGRTAWPAHVHCTRTLRMGRHPTQRGRGRSVARKRIEWTPEETRALTLRFAGHLRCDCQGHGDQHPSVYRPSRRGTKGSEYSRPTRKAS